MQTLTDIAFYYNGGHLLIKVDVCDKSTYINLYTILDNPIFQDGVTNNFILKLSRKFNKKEIAFIYAVFQSVVLAYLEKKYIVFSPKELIIRIKKELQIKFNKEL